MSRIKKKSTVMFFLKGSYHQKMIMISKKRKTFVRKE